MKGAKKEKSTVWWYTDASSVTGGTFTLSHGSVTSAPLRFNASQKKIDQTFAEICEEDAAVQAIRAKRRKKR